MNDDPGDNAPVRCVNSHIDKLSANVFRQLLDTCFFSAFNSRQELLGIVGNEDGLAIPNSKFSLG